MSRMFHEHPGGPTILTVPGLGNSGPAHWQTLWEVARADTSRVELGMWSAPHRNMWVTKLDRAIASARAPVILVAHSLGCLAVAWWAKLAPQPYGAPVAGALLVAPPDVECGDVRIELSGFAPAPRGPLPFPSILVASTDDPWSTIERAHSLAVDWGSHFVDAGEQGHLNAESDLGMWPDGQALLSRLLLAAGGESAPPSPAEVRRILAADATSDQRRGALH